MLDRTGRSCYNTSCSAGLAHLVERHLAKDLKTESKSAFIESLKAFQAQNPNFLSNIVNKELSRKYWAYGIIA